MAREAGTTTEAHLMNSMIHRLMHRCRLCARYFTMALDDDETCSCGGDFLVDPEFHPMVTAEKWRPYSDVEKESWRQAQREAMGSEDREDVWDEKTDADVTRTNGHHYPALVAAGK